MAAKLQTVTNDCTTIPSTERWRWMPPQWHAKIRRSATLSRGALPSRSYDFIPADSLTASASVGARRPWPLAVGELDACVRIHLSDFENEASASVGAAQAHPGRLPLVNSTLPQRGQND